MAAPLHWQNVRGHPHVCPTLLQPASSTELDQLQVPFSEAVEAERVLWPHLPTPALQHVVDAMARLPDRQAITPTLISSQLSKLVNGAHAYCEFLKLPQAQLVAKFCEQAVHCTDGYLWPDGTWLDHLAQNQYPTNPWQVIRIVGYRAAEYRALLAARGYRPVFGADAQQLRHYLREWHRDRDQYNKDFAKPPDGLERYAVVSYIQPQPAVQPQPATPGAVDVASSFWVDEVVDVVDRLVDRGVLDGHAVWFDKLASRQYRHSQKWWAAVATMQFMFNLVVLVLPLASMRQAYPAEYSRPVAVDAEGHDVMQRVCDHMRQCSVCAGNRALVVAANVDHILIRATLRTWPSIEQALGGAGAGLYISPRSQVGLAATLSVALAVLAATVQAGVTTWQDLEQYAAGWLPSTLMESGQVPSPSGQMPSPECEQEPACQGLRASASAGCQANRGAGCSFDSASNTAPAQGSGSGSRSGFEIDTITLAVGWMSAIACPELQQMAVMDRQAVAEFGSAVGELFQLWCVAQGVDDWSLHSACFGGVQNAIANAAAGVTVHAQAELHLPHLLTVHPTRVQAADQQDNEPHDDAAWLCWVASATINTGVRVHTTTSCCSMQTFAILQNGLAVRQASQVHGRLRRWLKRGITNQEMVVARTAGLTRLLASRGLGGEVYDPCDKIVAAVILASPWLFREAINVWGWQNDEPNNTNPLMEALAHVGVAWPEDMRPPSPNLVIMTLASQRSSQVGGFFPLMGVLKPEEPLVFMPSLPGRNSCGSVSNHGNAVTLPESLVGITCGAGSVAERLGHCLVLPCTGSLGPQLLNPVPWGARVGLDSAEFFDWMYRELQANFFDRANTLVLFSTGPTESQFSQGCTARTSMQGSVSRTSKSPASSTPVVVAMAGNTVGGHEVGGGATGTHAADEYRVPKNGTLPGGVMQSGVVQTDDNSMASCLLCEHGVSCEARAATVQLLHKLGNQDLGDDVVHALRRLGEPELASNIAGQQQSDIETNLTTIAKSISLFGLGCVAWKHHQYMCSREFRMGIHADTWVGVLQRCRHDAESLGVADNSFCGVGFLGLALLGSPVVKKCATCTNVVIAPVQKDGGTCRFDVHGHAVTQITLLPCDLGFGIAQRVLGVVRGRA